MTPSVTVRQWASDHGEPLTEAAVRAKFPVEKYRVSVYRYQPNTRIGGSMRRSICHVIQGAGCYLFKESVILRSGDVAELPEGRYSLEVNGGDDFVIVLCWELPFEFNRVQ